MNDDEYLATLRWTLLTILHTVEEVEGNTPPAAHARWSTRAHRRWRSRAEDLHASGLINVGASDTFRPTLSHPGYDPIGDQR